MKDENKMPNMNEIAPFLEAARQGENTDDAQFVAFAKKFDAVVLWGAGNLGTALGKKLIELGINVNIYWDIQSELIGKRNGLDVRPLYSGNFIPQNTLVIVCIGNATLRINKNLVGQLKENNWSNFIDGLYLLYALICPLSNERPLNPGVCTNFNDICSLCSCERLQNIVRTKTAQRKNIQRKNVFFIERVHFIVNNICNLKCTHCCVYINSYAKERKQNVSFSQIQQDMKIFMEAIDSFGSAILLGGETFLHKNIDRIISEMLSYDKFGVLVINTNGIAKIGNSAMNAMRDQRVNLSFSNYLHVLNEKQKNIYHKNIEIAKHSGVNIGRLNPMPLWNLSPTLENKQLTRKKMQEKKLYCNNKDFLYVYDGKVFPCTIAYSLFDLGVANYETDYAMLTPHKPISEIQENIHRLKNRSYYQSCGHCGNFGFECSFTNEVAKQGFDSRYAFPIHKKLHEKQFLLL
jgi:MoaA/NifB/PqqE/SkfB family radical SAM enzyme